MRCFPLIWRIASQSLAKCDLLNLAPRSSCGRAGWRDEEQPEQAGVYWQADQRVQLFLLDRHLNQVPIGVPGEIYVGGDCLALGYLRRPELTAERFILHHFEPGPSVRLFKTGDLGRYLANGEIEYLGRIDNQVKIRGMRVELGEIEAVLTCHPEVRDAVVLLAERSGQQRLSAYLEASAGRRIDVDELRRYLRSDCRSCMVPSDYFAVGLFRCSQWQD